MRLTEIVLRNLEPPTQGQKMYADDTLPGFGVRVSPGGTKTFCLVVGKDRQRISIGRYPTIGLADARAEAKRLLAERTLRRRQPARMKASEALERFLTEKAAKTKASTIAVYSGLIRKHFAKLLLKSLEDIQTDDVTTVTDKLLRNNLPGAAEHAFTAARTFFRWCVKRRYLQHSPIEGLDPPSKSKSRERVLSDDELRTVWQAADKQGGTFGAIVKLLILTGQRRGEIASLKSEWCSLPSPEGGEASHTYTPAPLAAGGEDTDSRLSSVVERPSRGEEISPPTREVPGPTPGGGTCTIPSSITKNKRTHTFPIGELSSALLSGQQPASSSVIRSGLIFPARGSDGAAPFNGWSKGKAQLDMGISSLCTESGLMDWQTVHPWTLHDLRRTYATNLQRLKVPLEVIEALLNHVSGTRAGIVGVYQKHRFEAEMRDAVMNRPGFAGDPFV